MANEATNNVINVFKGESGDRLRETLTETEFTRGKVTFLIDEVRNAELALEVFEIIRANLANIDTSGSQFGVASVSTAISAFAASDFRRMRDIFYRYIKFTKEGEARNPVALHKAQDMAFAGLSPLVHYELVARAWCVSFLGSTLSWLEDTGLRGRLDQAKPQSQAD